MPPREGGKKPNKGGKPAKPKISRTSAPPGMSLEEWQTQLRRQFGREQKFKLQNLGDVPAFSDFLVTNPASRRTYRVTVRGTAPGDNTCTCPDFATNTLGTCKHVEFTLAKLERSRKAAAELKAGYRPPHGEVFLRYGSRRQVCYRPPVEENPALARVAAKFFDAAGALKLSAAPRFDEFVEHAGKHDPDLRVHYDVLGFLA